MGSISVVLPFYNRRGTLVRALNSICKQTLPPCEIIAVDDASDDAGRELIEKSFPEVTLLTHAENKGVSSARNLGISQARGEWIALLDSDDEWLPNKLAEQWAALEKWPKYKIVHCDEIWIRNGKRVNSMLKYKKYGGYIFDRCLPLCAISPSSVIIHRQVFDKVGLFDETLPACEDYDMWLRMCLRYPVYFVDQPLVKKYGGHADQLSCKYWGMDRFRIFALEKILQEESLSAQAREAVIATLLEKAQILINGARKRSNQKMIQKYEKLISQYQI